MITYAVETSRETDGRWIADCPQLPGAMAYGTTKRQAIANAQALALRILADRLEHEARAPLEFRMTLAA